MKTKKLFKSGTRPTPETKPEKKHLSPKKGQVFCRISKERSETDLAFQVIAQLGDTDALLLHGIAVADGDSIVIE